MKHTSFFLIPLFLISCETEEKKNTLTEPAPIIKNEVFKPIFDVPFLIDKNVDQIIKILGKPSQRDKTSDFVEINGIKELEMTFSKDGKDLLVTYDSNSKNVVDFFISVTDPEGMSADISGAKQLLNVTSDSPHYSIEPVKAFKDPNKFTGIKVLRK